MKKSEKIILSVVMVAAIYFVVDLSMSRQKKKSVKVQTKVQTQASSKGLADLSAQISAISSPSDGQTDRLAAMINEPWPATVFVSQYVEFGPKKVVETPQEVVDLDLQAAANQLIYSGFLAMGTDQIAIINGMDYRIGEQVNGFTVTSISQEAIGVSQKDATFTVPASTERAEGLETKQE